MKYYIIAGEASGDLHASNLMKGLRAADPSARFRVWGGDLMQAQGGALVKHIRDLAFMGAWEVVKHLPEIMGNLALCRKDVQAFAPDVLILVDYPGFNLKMARYAKSVGIKTFYYISPKVWAWKKNRIHDIKKFVDRLFVIFPFETGFFAEHQMEVFYEGNPLVDAVEEYLRTAPSREEFMAAHSLSQKPLIALIPGSRKQELKWILPEMMQVVKKFPDHQFVVSGVSSFHAAYYKKLMGGIEIPVVYGQTYALMQHAQAALVTSGTATLETALFGTPQVVVYKTSPITYAIGRYFVRVRFFSLVNIIMNREVVPELLQYRLAERMEQKLGLLLRDSEQLQNMLKGYHTIRTMLGEPGVSRKVAQKMVAFLHA